jgi:hypothetical protein
VIMATRSSPRQARLESLLDVGHDIAAEDGAGDSMEVARRGKRTGKQPKC